MGGWSFTRGPLFTVQFRRHKFASSTLFLIIIAKLRNDCMFTRRLMTLLSARRQKLSLNRNPATPALRQPLWVFGFVLLIIGTLLDFVAFGLAPQSLLAPLAALTLAS